MKAFRYVLMVLLPLAVLVGGGFAAKKLIDSYQEPEKKPAVVEPPLVRVLEVEQRPIRLTVEAEGVVAPRTETELAPEVSGRVLWASPSLVAGGFFDKGEKLLEVDTREYELAEVRARAAVAQSKLRLATEEQEASVARAEWESLGEGEASPLVLREPQLAEAKAALASAEAALEQTRFDLERTAVKAPYDGRVREKRVDVGQYVQRGASLATVYAVDVAEVRLPVADEELAFVSLPLAYRGQDTGDARGPSVKLTADFGGKRFSWDGRIVRTEGEIDPETRMVHVIAQVQDPYAQTSAGKPPLAVGMFVEAEIRGRSVRTVALPRTAVRGENVVWVVGDSNRIEFREIEILREERERVLVRGGLAPGEKICLSVLEAAVNGMEVRVVAAETAQAAE